MTYISTYECSCQRDREREAEAPLGAAELARAAQGHQRKVMAVEVVIDPEAALQLGALSDPLARLLVAEVHARAEAVARKARAGVVRLVPGAVVALRVDQEADAATNRALVRSVVRRHE